MRHQHQQAAIPPEVLQRPDVQDAIARHDFGAVFALARKWAGISYSKIAEACDIKPERVGTLARGQGSITTYEKITRIADALRIPGHMLGLAPRSWETSRDPQLLIVSRHDGGESVRRRDFLKASAVGAGTAAVPDLLRMFSGQRIGAEVPDLLRQRAARLRRLDDVLGGGDTFRLYLSEYELTRSMLRESRFSEPVELELLAILAEQAQQAGWAAFDSGDNKNAEWLYRESHSVAMQAANTALAGNALAFLAYQAIGNDPNGAVKVAEASCATAGKDSPGSVRALLHERRAWAHAVAGNAREADRALDVAKSALTQDPDVPQPDWSSWVDGQELRIMEGRCWTELRRPLRAVPILEGVLSGFDDAHARDKALYSCSLAESYMMAGEIEAAAMIADRVLDLSVGVASVRPRQRVEPILLQLEASADVPLVASVLEKSKG
jgi:tetratricopeptide (TPR) repeat protein